ncbi:MAG: hypothetical protein M0P49_06960, partial [Bacilli bacterium]|nr:hypothetical protein [Bacilli bacterium]
MHDKITMSDVRKRMSSVNSKFKNSPDMNMTSLREQVSKSGSIKLVEKFLENWDSMYTNQGQCFTEVMEVFKEFWNRTDNVSDIHKVSNIICMNILPKLESTSNPIHDLVVSQSRDARNVFKRQVRRNSNYLKDLADPNTGSIRAKDLNNQDKKTIDGINPLPDKTDTSDLLLGKTSTPKEEAVMTAYSNIEEAVSIINICDRVLSNHNKLSKRFNIDKVVRESVNCNDDIQDCIYELCGMIDTYDNMPFKVKYNVALENVLFVLYKNGVQYENSSVLKDITEYFLYKSDLSDDNKKAMKSLLEKTSFYGDRDKIEIDYMIDPDDSDGEYTSFMNSDKNIWVKDNIMEFVLNEGVLDVLSSGVIRSIINKYSEFKSSLKKNKEPKNIISENRSVKELFDECVELNGDQKKMLDMAGLKAVSLGEKEFIDAASGFGKALQEKASGVKYRAINFIDDNKNKFVLLHIEDSKGTYLLSIIAKKPNDNNFAFIIPVWSRYGLMNEIECKTKSNPDYVTHESFIDTKESIKDLMNKFKLESNKTIEKVKNIASKIYTKSPENIIEETPNFLSWIRTAVMLSTIGINPIAGVVINFTDQLIALGLK